MSFNSWYLNSSIHQAGVSEVRSLFGMKPSAPGGGLVSRAAHGGGIFRLFGPAFLAVSAYQGYKEGGVWGAAKGMAGEAATWYAFGAAMKVMAPIAVGAIGLAGIGAAAAYSAGVRPRHLMRPWTNEYVKKHARVEMATPIMDEYGTVATMRQRSIRAIQNSKLNGRTALGNEATYSFRPYHR